MNERILGFRPLKAMRYMDNEDYENYRVFSSDCFPVVSLEEHKKVIKQKDKEIACCRSKMFKEFDKAFDREKIKQLEQQLSEKDKYLQQKADTVGKLIFEKAEKEKIIVEMQDHIDSVIRLCNEKLEQKKEAK